MVIWGARLVGLVPLELTPDSEKQELWDELQRVRKALEDAKKAEEKAKRDLVEYKKRHPETVGVKHGKPYAFRSPSEPVAPSGKKPGGQPGHLGHRRARPETIDQRVSVPVSCCPDCGGENLSSDVQETRTRIVEDLPTYRPTVTQYQIDRRYCRDCKTLVETPIDGALPGATLGLRAMLVIAWLRYANRVPQEVVPVVMEGLFGLRVSSGGVQNILEQLANHYAGLYDEMLEDLRSRATKHGDESSWRTNGLNEYAWAFVSKWETIFIVGATRKHEVALGVLGPEAAGVLTVDGYSAYRTLAEKTRLKLQRCWAHILGDAEELAEMHGLDGRQLRQDLRLLYAKAKAHNGHATPAQVADLQAALNRAANRPFTSNHCARFARNLIANREDLFRFVTNPDVEPTNNRAERAIRPLAVARKISGGSRSSKGARIRARLMSIQHTMTQRGLSFLEGPTLQPRPASAG